MVRKEHTKQKQTDKQWVRKTDSCSIDAVARTNCKECRYQKCVLVEMQVGKLRRNITEKEVLGKKTDKYKVSIM